MAYDDPQNTHNPTTAQVIPASWGDIVRDDLEYLARNAPHCRVYNTTATTLSNATFTALTFDSERYDVGGCHSTSSNTGRLTVPAGEGGKYMIGASVEFEAQAVPAGIRILAIRVDGSTYIAYTSMSPSGTNDDTLSINVPYSLAAGSYVELMVYQSSGGGLDIQVQGNYSPEFWMSWFRL